MDYDKIYKKIKELKEQKLQQTPDLIIDQVLEILKDIIKRVEKLETK